MSNHLDQVWAAMSTADRIVLLGHDRNYLDTSDRARLTTLLSDAAAARTAKPHARTAKGRRRASRAR